MESLPIEIIKIICPQIDQDIHFICLTMTCKFCYTLSNYRPLTNRYTFTKISHIVKKYAFTNIYYDCNKFNPNILSCSKLKILLLGNNYQDHLSPFFSNFPELCDIIPELNEIVPIFFYKNVDSLPLISNVQIRKNIVMSIICNIFCHEFYNSELELYHTKNHCQFPIIFNKISVITIITINYINLMWSLGNNMINMRKKYQILNSVSNRKRLKLIYKILKNVNFETNEYMNCLSVLLSNNYHDFSVFALTHTEKTKCTIQFLIDMLKMEEKFIKKLYDLIIQKLNLENMNQYILYCEINKKIQNNEIKLISINQVSEIRPGSLVYCLDKKGIYIKYGHVIEISEDYFIFLEKYFQNKSELLKINKVELLKVEKLWMSC